MEKNYSHYQVRKPLYEMLPLDTPLSIHICPSTFCNFKCRYCKHSVQTQQEVDGKNRTIMSGYVKEEFMDMNLFNMIINQLKDFPQKLKLINFAWLGEPLLHPQIADMVKIAKESGVSERVEIVTNASKLNNELSDKLISAGLDRIRISLQGLNANDYNEISSYKLDFDSFVRQIKYFFDHKQNTQVYIKIIDAMLKEEKDEIRFKQIFSDICDNLNIEYLVPLVKELDISSMKKEIDKGYFGNIPKDLSVCSPMFYMMVIGPNGVAMPCTAADNYINNLGIVTSDNTLLDIWNGEKLRNNRINMLDGKKDKNEICKDCTIPKYHTASEDYLDEYREVLKQKY